MLLQLRITKAAAIAYEMLIEYLEDARDQLKEQNPLRAKERKINLLTDSDEEERLVYLRGSVTQFTQCMGSAVVGFPIYLAV